MARAAVRPTGCKGSTVPSIVQDNDLFLARSELLATMLKSDAFPSTLVAEVSASILDAAADNLINQLEQPRSHPSDATGILRALAAVPDLRPAQLERLVAWSGTTGRDLCRPWVASILAKRGHDTDKLVSQLLLHEWRAFEANPVARREFSLLELLDLCATLNESRYVAALEEILVGARLAAEALNEVSLSAAAHTRKHDQLALSLFRRVSQAAHAAAIRVDSPLAAEILHCQLGLDSSAIDTDPLRDAVLACVRNNPTGSVALVVHTWFEQLPAWSTGRMIGRDHMARLAGCIGGSGRDQLLRSWAEVRNVDARLSIGAGLSIGVQQSDDCESMHLLEQYVHSGALASLDYRWAREPVRRLLQEVVMCGPLDRDVLLDRALLANGNERTELLRAIPYAWWQGRAADAVRLINTERDSQGERAIHDPLAAGLVRSLIRQSDTPVTIATEIVATYDDECRIAALQSLLETAFHGTESVDACIHRMTVVDSLMAPHENRFWFYREARRLAANCVQSAPDGVYSYLNSELPFWMQCALFARLPALVQADHGATTCDELEQLLKQIKRSQDIVICADLLCVEVLTDRHSSDDLVSSIRHFVVAADAVSPGAEAVGWLRSYAKIASGRAR